MYSGWLLTDFSGAIMGAHQRIDRIARRNLRNLGVPISQFPTARQILHFEGKNGPDGVKKKSPGRDEPAHFCDPANDKDSELPRIIENHYNRLVQNLKKNNMEGAAFEAAWLAHAIVDGLTPAHHFQYEEKVEILRGESKESRNSFKNKVFIKGTNLPDTAKKNWAFWGPNGLFTQHYMFEFGVSTTMIFRRFQQFGPSHAEVLAAPLMDVKDLFVKAAEEVAALNLYDAHYQKGWTQKLAKTVRTELLPRVLNVVTLAWYKAMYDAGYIKQKEVKS